MQRQESLKRKALSGVVWKFSERIAAQGVTTIVSIILARILEPSHYGVIALVNVFITICNVFVVTGLGESLIQKKDADELDFSSIFYINVGFSVVLYLILFFLAPSISKFYDNQYPQLVLIIRVMGIRLIFAAVNSIQSAKIFKKMNFKKYFWVTIIGTIISAVVGISMALSGFGVWALVAQYMTNTTVDTLMLFVFDRWVPKFKFSINRAIPLFGYGWKVLVSSLISTVYNELSEFIIGKVYSSKDLAFYSKGGTYPKLITNNLQSALTSVSFPMFSKIQDNKFATHSALSRTLKLTSYIIFPAMAGFAMIAEPFVRVLLTEKWLPCVPYLQMICIIYAVSAIQTPKLQCLNANGYSNIYLKTSIYKKICGVFILLCVFKIRVFWIVISRLISALLDAVIDSIATQKYIGYSFFRQLKDISVNLFLTLIMVLAIYISEKLLSGLNSLLLMVIEIIIGVAVYILVSNIFKNDSFKYIVNILRSFFKRRAKKQSTEMSG